MKEANFEKLNMYSKKLNSPVVVKSIGEMQRIRKKLNGEVNFVPTMGALHAGHAELMTQAKKMPGTLILSIYVNKTQFNDLTDFEKYPQTFEVDFKIASECGVDYIFYPSFAEMYPDEYKYKVIETEFSKILCGKDRPGHFDGVLSVVMKLFNIIKPTSAFFGEKDFQQLELVRGMVRAFFIDTEIIAVPTVREESGLALSSRNQRLSEHAKQQAAIIYQTITQSKSDQEAQEKLESFGFNVDYVTDLNQRRFVAAKLENVRLIDNVQI